MRIEKPYRDAAYKTYLRSTYPSVRNVSFSPEIFEFEVSFWATIKVAVIFSFLFMNLALVLIYGLSRLVNASPEHSLFYVQVMALIGYGIFFIVLIRCWSVYRKTGKYTFDFARSRLAIGRDTFKFSEVYCVKLKTLTWCDHQGHIVEDYHTLDPECEDGFELFLVPKKYSFYIGHSPFASFEDKNDAIWFANFLAHHMNIKYKFNDDEPIAPYFNLN